MMHNGPDHGVPRPCRGLSFGRAFTVIELIMVLAIIGVLAAIATPRISNALAQNRVLQAAARLKADLQRTAAQARAVSRSWTITFTASGYTITGNTATGAASSSTVTLTDEPYLTSISTITCGADRALTFSGHGYCSETGRLRLTCGNAICEIDVAPDQSEPTLTLR